ncbi:nucleotidyltransferase domain-containing protein [archaeon]|jgi:predicted nucleotidyltransferase|nr:nucleotidyltransferase domain-containing protein [archaeon]MBT3450382.1 nucleotidyltransferase domain-containing protein [archaeon]MBT6868843.1 nucleotidyltransferase domain-containing protein [archaeon]MBT7192936.1 nucleotidyltransferase domain-containing protein [archaeon]MBT7380902.1 nucleotidyltransferase domain-containing protein [archaeon]
MVQKNRHMSKKIDITSLYLSDYNLYFSGREIGRLVKINHQTAMNLLKQLVKEKVLTIVKKGRSNLYYLNLDSFECTYYLQIAEIVKARNALSNVELKLVIEKIVSLCETVIVFGSFSSGKQKNSSDIDLVVVSPRSKVKIQDEIKIFPREINIEYVTWNSFAKSLNKKNHLAIEIKKNHLVYGNVHGLVEIYKDYQK